MLTAQRASKPSQAANAGRMVLLPEQLQLLQWQGEILVGMNKICMLPRPKIWLLPRPEKTSQPALTAFLRPQGWCCAAGRWCRLTW